MLRAIKALSIFDLHGAKGKCNPEIAPELFNIIAEAIDEPVEVFQAQFDDIFPRAVCESSSIAKSDEPNKSAWRDIIRKTNANLSVARAHPTQVLNKGLILYYVFGVSSSGVEQSFSQGSWGYTNRRLGAFADTEEFCLKVILDLPHHDKTAIISKARMIWVMCYGQARQCATRISKGVRKPRSGAITEGFMAQTETGFVRERRRAIASCVDVQPTLSHEALMAQASADLDGFRGWGEGHTKELHFQKGKLRARMVQAVAEGTLKGTPELKAEVNDHRDSMIKAQRARERKYERDQNAMGGMTGQAVLAKIMNKRAYIHSHVPVVLTPRIRAAFNRYGIIECDKHKADVFVVCRPGHPDLGKSLMTTTALRGCFHVTPQLLLSNGMKGVALGWKEVAHITRVVFVSSACEDRQKAALDFVRSILLFMSTHAVEIVVGDWDVLAALIEKHRRYPARVIALVTSDELALPVVLSIDCEHRFPRATYQIYFSNPDLSHNLNVDAIIIVMFLNTWLSRSVSNNFVHPF